MYETFCKACGEGVGEDKYVYVGESARSVCERYGEHVGDYKSSLEKSHMSKHISLVHSLDANVPEFDIRVVKFCKTAIERQVLEAVRIQHIANVPGIKIMNSKSEFNCCTLPCIVMFCGDQSSEEGSATNGSGEGNPKGDNVKNKNKKNRNRFNTLKWGEVGVSSSGVVIWRMVW